GVRGRVRGGGAVQRARSGSGGEGVSREAVGTASDGGEGPAAGGPPAPPPSARPRPVRCTPARPRADRTAAAWRSLVASTPRVVSFAFFFSYLFSALEP